MSKVRVTASVTYVVSKEFDMHEKDAMAIAYHANKDMDVLHPDEGEDGVCQWISRTFDKADAHEVVACIDEVEVDGEVF